MLRRINQVIIKTALAFLFICNSALAQTWSAVGTGGTGANALTVYNGELIVGGTDKWNGTIWTSMGSAPFSVYALAVYNNELYAGGWQGTPPYIAKWNGSGWTTVGTGLNGRVYSLAAYSAELYAGGQMTIAPNFCSGIAKWDGSIWSGAATGLSNPPSSPMIKALAVYNGELYAGGYFTTIGAPGGLPANYIAKWNGTTWMSLGSGLNGVVSALAVYNGELYAGGSFTVAGGVATSNIAKWNGTSWSTVGNVSGISGNVTALASFNGILYAGGSFNSADGIAVSNIAAWNGIAWARVGYGQFSGVNGTVNAIADFNNELYVVGSFTKAGDFLSISGGISVNGIAKITPCTVAPAQPTNINGPQNTCLGTTQAYSVPQVAGANTYTWSMPSGWTGTSLNETISPITGISGTVSVTANNLCGSSASQTISVTVNPIPTPVCTQAGSVLSTAPGYLQYVWYRNSAIIFGATTNTYTVTQDGVYSVSVTDNNFCTGKSNIITITNLSVEELSGNGVKVHPNPNRGSFKLEIPGFVTPTEITILDVQGRMVKKEAIPSGQKEATIEMAEFPSGVYFVKLRSGTSVFHSKFVLEK